VEDYKELYKNRVSIKEITRLTGISRSTLWRKLKDEGLVRTQSESKRGSVLSKEHKQHISDSLKGVFVGKDNWNTKNIKNDYNIITDDLAYIVGVMAGDGYIVSSSGIGLQATDEDFVMEFARKCKKQFGIEGKLYYTKPSKLKDWRNGKTYIRKPTTIFRLNSIIIRDFFIKTKTFKIIDCFNHMNKIAFLRGLWDSEGSVCVSGYTNVVNFTHNDEQLCIIFKKMLLELTSIDAKISKQRQRGNYILYFYKKEYIKKFYEVIKPTIKRKRDVFEHILKVK